ncbi:MAG: 2-hydroxychromene-2-carboxylate isomerase [Hyphomicrobiaceae bacterium]
MQVDFYLSLPSRYSYLASTQLDRIARRTGCTFVWKPLNNHAILERNGSNPFRSERLPSGQYAWSYREYDARCWADYYGVPFVEPVNFRRDPPYIVRACHAAAVCGRLVPYCARIFQAIFIEGRAIEEHDLAGLAADAGIDREEFTSALAGQDAARRERDVLDEAVAKGVFGVPSFVLGDRLFWGNDRLILLEHALTRAAATTAAG